MFISGNIYLLRRESASVRWLLVGDVFFQMEISCWPVITCGPDGSVGRTHIPTPTGRMKKGRRSEVWPSCACDFSWGNFFLVCFTKPTSGQAAQDWLRSADNFSLDGPSALLIRGRGLYFIQEPTLLLICSLHLQTPDRSGCKGPLNITRCPFLSLKSLTDFRENICEPF